MQENQTERKTEKRRQERIKEKRTGGKKRDREKQNEKDNGRTCKGGAKRPHIGVFTRHRLRFVSFRFVSFRLSLSFAHLIPLKAKLGFLTPVLLKSKCCS